MQIPGKDEGFVSRVVQLLRFDDISMTGVITLVIERLMDFGIEGGGPFSSAQDVADLALADHADAELAIDAMVRSHLKLVAVNGFVTSLGGFVAIPIALPANVLGFYLLATRLVAGIAVTRGHDIGGPEVRSAILLTLVGADADDLLTRASNTGTGRLVNLAVERLPGAALLAVRKGVTFRVLAQIGRKWSPRSGKVVPLVGGFAGAGLDSYLLKRIAEHARLEFVWKSGLVS